MFFISNIDPLDPSHPLYEYDIWLYDITTMTLTRLTDSGNERQSVGNSVTADGTKVVFHSNGDFFNQGIPENQFEIWLYDTTTLTVTRLTTSSLANRYSFNPGISPDGSKVAFSSDADFLNQNILQGHREIWLYDTKTLILTRLTTTTTPSGASRL